MLVEVSRCCWRESSVWVESSVNDATMLPRRGVAQMVAQSADPANSLSRLVEIGAPVHGCERPRYFCCILSRRNDC
jgi:hypothetical protein